jgi:hypothetical protein
VVCLFVCVGTSLVESGLFVCVGMSLVESGLFVCVGMSLVESGLFVCLCEHIFGRNGLNIGSS